MEEIVLDRKTFKALAMDTRIDIIKSLNQRRKTAAELSKELHLSVPTVVEHLEKLQGSGLIQKEKQGKKWVYYALTSKGQQILKPKLSTAFVFALSISIVLMLIGSLNLFTLVGTPVSYTEEVAVPGENVKSYDYSEAADDETTAEGEVLTAGASADEEAKSTSASEPRIEQKEQMQTITKTEIQYSQMFSYEYLGVLLIGVFIFLFLMHRRFVLKK